MLVPNNSRGQIVISLSITIGATLPVAVALRLLARWKTKAGLGVDDYWILLSLVPIYGMLVSGGLRECFGRRIARQCSRFSPIVVFKGGVGRHTDTLSYEEIVFYMKVIVSPSPTRLFSHPALRNPRHSS